MAKKKQFTLKWLLIELTLMAILAALVKWIWFTNHGRASDEYGYVLILGGVPASFAALGGIIGGVFGRFAAGAIGGVLFCLMFVLLLAVLLPPY